MWLPKVMSVCCEHVMYSMFDICTLSLLYQLYVARVHWIDHCPVPSETDPQQFQVWVEQGTPIFHSIHNVHLLWWMWYT